MSHDHALALAAQVLGDSVHQIDRAVLAAGAADGDIEIGAVVQLEGRDPLIEKTFEALQHLHRFRLRLEIADHFFVLAVERLELGLPVGIGQAAGVENHIGVLGHAVFVAEGLKHHREAVGRAVVQALAHQIPQLIEVGVGGVDDHVRVLPQRREQRALPADGLGQGAVFRRQRMPAAGLLEAGDEHVVLGF